MSTLSRKLKEADTWINNLSIELGSGITNQLEAMYQMGAHPVRTVNALAQMGLGAVRDPQAFGSTVANALVDTGERALSGPLGLGEVIGENLSPPAAARGCPGPRRLPGRAR